MADEKDKVAKLEERLAKATETFKTMKVQMEEKDKEIESLKNRVAELEDELTLNGGAAEEVEGLKGRLEKAKEIFATQKSKITELTELNNTHVSRITELEADVESRKALAEDLNSKVKNLENVNSDLYDKLESIRNIING